MKSISSTSVIILGVSIALGLFLGGLTISRALYKTRAADRFVTVKGLAEREVPADLAIWPITFKEVGNDLTSLQKNIDRNRDLITGFLVEQGFEKTGISHSPPRIIDVQAENYYGDRNQPYYRFKAQTTVTLRSGEVQKVKETMEKSGELVGKGIVMAENWENRTEFLFTSLNEIKPGMIREATINAREAADKFAEDSGSKVGNIRKATQGLFSISDRDANSPDIKVVRVVTTMEYFLTDN